MIHTDSKYLNVNFFPILFKDFLLSKIKVDIKTNTRRIMKLEPMPWTKIKLVTDISSNSKKKLHAFIQGTEFKGSALVFPYGNIGDILWVKESFHETILEDGSSKYLYRIDDVEKTYETGFWKSKMYMPKKAARIFLKITSVTIERVNDISEDDAIMEGVEKNVEMVNDFQTKFIYKDYTGRNHGCADARSSFMTLWVSINGGENWEKNPLVWVVRFERISDTSNIELTDNNFYLKK